MNIVFLGTPQIAVKSLEYLIEQPDIKVVAVITQADKPKGRGHKLEAPPIKQVAQAHNIEVYQPLSIRKDAELIELLKSKDIDFFVTFAFGQILSQEVLDIPKVATINLHASLLPKLRGANPIQQAILNGDKQTGVSTMITVLGLDEGDVCLTQQIEISQNMNILELKEEISNISPSLIHKTLKGLQDGTLSPKPQDNKQATYANKCAKSDALINWEQTAEQIHNKIRAMLDFPVAHTFLNNKMVKLIDSEIIRTDKKADFGEVIEITKQGILVGTLQNALLIKKVKPESKGLMNAFDFANGAKIQSGTKFEDKRS